MSSSFPDCRARITLSVTGETATGILVQRKRDGTWGYPGFVRIRGGTFATHIGETVSKAALVLQSQDAVEAIVNGEVELGGSLTVAIGPKAIDESNQGGFDILTFYPLPGEVRGIFA